MAQAELHVSPSASNALHDPKHPPVRPNAGSLELQAAPGPVMAPHRLVRPRVRVGRVSANHLAGLRTWGGCACLSCEQRRGLCACTSLSSCTQRRRTRKRASLCRRRKTHHIVCSVRTSLRLACSLPARSTRTRRSHARTSRSPNRTLSSAP